VVGKEESLKRKGRKEAESKELWREREAGGKNGIWWEEDEESHRLIEAEGRKKKVRKGWGWGKIRKGLGSGSREKRGKGKRPVLGMQVGEGKEARRGRKKRRWRPKKPIIDEMDHPSIGNLCALGGGTFWLFLTSWLSVQSFPET
jgi:hypothetical protein